MKVRPADEASPRIARRLAVVAVLAALTLAAASAVAAAAPVWRVDPDGNSSAARGGTLSYVVEVANVGDASTTGAYSLTITLPRGMVGASAGGAFGLLSCPGAAGAQVIVCTGNTDISPAGYELLLLDVEVQARAPGVLTAQFAMDGGGAATVTTGDATTVTDDEPAFGVAGFDGSVNDANGDPDPRAGAHPYAASTTVEFNTTTHPNPFIGVLWPVEAVKDIVVDLPLGFIGNPLATPRCVVPDLASSKDDHYNPLCGPASQVGAVFIKMNGSPLGINTLTGPLPVFNLVPPDDVPARFGFNFAGTVVTMNAEVRPADNGVTVTVNNASEGIALFGTTLTFWGSPSDSRHTPERGCTREHWPGIVGNTGPSCSTEAEPGAFLRNPTSCNEPGRGVTTTLRTDSWKHPGTFRSASFVSHEPPGYPLPPDQWGPELGPTGCDRVPFRPALTGTPDTPPHAGGPSGFAFDLSLPQDNNPDAIGTGDVRRVVVTLPEGLRVAPGSADGLAACSEQQAALRLSADATCPDASKIGSARIDTPLLANPLTGAVYLATPFANPFGTMVAMYIVVRGSGITIKLAGKAELDPNTGQVTATFDDLPQTPFSNTHLEFKAGSRAPLALPKRCGTYTIHSVLTSWSGKDVVSDSSFTLTENARGDPCPNPFTPEFHAGTTNPVAGTAAPFVMNLSRDDEDQELRSLSMDMAKGILGRPGDVTQCSEGDANAGTCGPDSKVGSVTVGAGAGLTPFYIDQGRAYFTRPFHGMTYGLSIVVPAKAGPFDLGDVIVRAGIDFGRRSGILRVVSEPFPQVVRGIPVDLRDVRVNIDRDKFIINPTSCAEKRIDGVVASTEGATANVSSRFQVGECGRLAVRPKPTNVVGGNGRTGKGASTPLTTTLVPARNSANLRFVRVTLPTTINARLPIINRACTLAEFDANNCRKAMAGTAVVVTPLLREPLRGGVFFVRNGHPLPDIFVAIRGEVDFDLIGRVSIPHSLFLRTTFDDVPDVPFSKFTLSLVAGPHGPLGNATNLCSRRGRASKVDWDFIGQNGKVFQTSKRLTVRGCGGGSGKRARGGRRGR